MCLVCEKANSTQRSLGEADEEVASRDDEYIIHMGLLDKCTRR